MAASSCYDHGYNYIVMLWHLAIFLWGILKLVNEPVHHIFLIPHTIIAFPFDEVCQVAIA